MGQPHLIHDAFSPGANFTFRVVDEFEHEAVAHQIGRMHSERLGKLQELGGAVVGRFDLPPQLKSEQALVEAARPLALFREQLVDLWTEAPRRIDDPPPSIGTNWSRIHAA